MWIGISNGITIGRCFSSLLGIKGIKNMVSVHYNYKQVRICTEA